MRKELLIPLFLLLLNSFLSAQQENNPLADTSHVYYVVDTMPRMPDSTDLQSGFRKLFLQEFVYPDSLECGIYSGIYFDFIISSDGTVRDAKVTFPGNYPECADDYAKLGLAGKDFYEQLPTFIPGRFQGEEVNVRYTFFIRVHLQ